MKRFLLLSCYLIMLSCGKKNDPKKETSLDNQPKIEDTTSSDANVDPTLVAPLTNKNQIDLEKLKDSIDLNMDISNLSVSDLRILRNSFAAKQGYCFMKADLRGVFSSTSWYDERMDDRFWKEEEGADIEPITYTDDEKAFIEKLQQRETELLAKNFIEKGNRRHPNLKNIVNLFQMEETPQELMTLLEKNGFAIVPNDNIQLFHVYEKNDYHEFPNFVTTDMYMQLFHMYFGYILRKIEEEQFIPIVAQICKSMMKDMQAFADQNSDPELKEFANYNKTYYAIAYSLLTNENIIVTDGYQEFYETELNAILQKKDIPSTFLEQPFFAYSMFKPRGHYTRTEELKRYFKAMMWLQTAPFCLNNDMHLRRALLSASMLSDTSNRGNKILKKYQAIMEPINFIIGQPDNVSFLDLVSILQKEDYSIKNLLTQEEPLTSFRNQITTIAKTKNKISAKEAGTCVDKINFIPQRYLSDNEVLQELVDAKSEVSKRAYPKGLDVMAAFGSKPAEHILLNELKEGESWDQYPKLLSDMTQKMTTVDWGATLYNKWIESLLELQKPNDKYPYFMQTPQWDKKNLNASLASWAELKHDAILYAEQPMAAECGDGGPPAPYTVGYVEPNIAYWEKVIELLNLTTEVLQKNELITPAISGITNNLKENAQFLLTASEKELAGEILSKNEYTQIELIGSTFEWLTLDLVKQKDQYLSSWDDVTGPDKSIAVIADIYTANGTNNPDKGILHVGTGNVNDIFVVVDIEGYLYLTKGAVFSYHEFHLPMGNRLTDEEWQEMLDKNQAPDIPGWIKEIIAPVSPPKSNEKIFYSSGC